jgi:hypothetical protein
MESVKTYSYKRDKLRISWDIACEFSFILNVLRIKPLKLSASDLFPVWDDRYMTNVVQYKCNKYT